MSVSRDRIEFTLNAENQTIAKQTAVAACKAFGIPEEEAYDMVQRRTVIRCRPSQFGRFVIYRMKAGYMTGGISNLIPKIIEAQPEPAYTDVSKNRHIPSLFAAPPKRSGTGWDY